MLLLSVISMDINEFKLNVLLEDPHAHIHELLENILLTIVSPDTNL